jgi:hypothetical protein
MTPDTLILVGIIAAIILTPIIALVIRIFCLQAACALSNVEDVSFFWALLVVLIEGLVGGLIVGGVAFGLFLAAQVLGWTPWGTGVLVTLGTLPLGIGLAALLYMLLLRVSFLRGVRIRVLEVFVLLVIVGLLGGLGMVGLSIYQIASGPPQRPGQPQPVSALPPALVYRA